MENNSQETVIEATQKKTKIWPWVVLVVFASSFFGAVFGFMAGNAKNFLGNSAKETKSISQEVQKVVMEDSVITQTVEKSSLAVVSIVISKDVPKYRSMSLFDFFYQRAPQNGETEKQKVGGGSGFLVTNSGMVVTNKHVVEDPTADYTVVMSDGKEYPAKVLARDPIQDVAVIKIEGDNFPTLPLGDSDQMKTGQTVIAIGNSLGEFSNTVSKGIISGLKRNLTAGSALGGSEQLNNIIQTDAAINPGNSGGPLLNINGEVIGINVAIAQGAQSVGFAIPVNQVKKIITQVKDTGKISSPFLGVRYVIVDAELKVANNLAFEYGAIVTRGEKISDLAVVPGSPADKAGIVENDIILEINGQKIDAQNPIANVIANSSVGDKITLKVWHKGVIKDVEATLEERK
jgi:S1-C subfamily serine protease